jgi:hypothetical protein
MALFCCFISLPIPALSDDWIYIGRSDGANVYYNKESLVILPNGNVRAWFKWEYKNKKSKKQFWEFDCKEEKIALIAYVNYDQKKNVSSSDTSEESKKIWHLMLPESFGETMLSTICTAALDQQKKSQSFTSKIRLFISDTVVSMKPLWLFCSVMITCTAILYSLFSLSKYLLKRIVKLPKAKK